MSSALLAARLLLGGLFTTSAVAKWLDRTATADALGSFGVPGPITPPLAILLPTIECLTALLLLPASTAWQGSVLAVALLSLFSGAIAVNLLRGRRPACNCFGQMQSRPIGPETLVRNAVFAGPALFVLTAGIDDAGPGAFDWTVGMSAAESALSVVSALLAAAVVALLFFVRRLTNEQARLREAVTVVERLYDMQEAHLRGMEPAVVPALPKADGVQLVIGALAPAFEVATPGGGTVRLSDVLSTGRPVLLLFVSRHCNVCHEMLPQVAEWTTALAPHVSVLAITAGTLDDNRDTVRAHPSVPLTFAGAVPLADMYAATWVPAALVIGPDGRVARAAVFGRDAMTQMVAEIAGGRVTDEVASTAPPDFLIEMPDGATVTRDRFLGEHGLVTLFWSATCPHCTALVDDLRQWQTSRPAHAPNLALVAQNRAQLGDTLGLPVIIDSDATAIRAMRMTGTPWARLIDASGRLRPFDIAGPVHVRQLLGIPPRSPRGVVGG